MKLKLFVAFFLLLAPVGADAGGFPALLTGAKKYTITVTSGANGTVSPSTVKVPAHKSKTFTILGSAGYLIDALTVDGVGVDTAAVKTFTNVTANHTISATFKLGLIPFTDAFSTGTNLGARWISGGTWVLSGGKAMNTPTAGDEMFGNPGFDSDLAGWTVEENSSGTIAQSSGKALGTVGMAYTYDYLGQSLTTTIGRWFRVSVDFASTSGANYARILYGLPLHGSYLSTTDLSAGAIANVFRSTLAANYITFRYSGNAGATSTVDNFSTKPFLASTLYGTVDVGVSNYSASVDLVVTRDTQAGMVICYGDTLNLAVVYHNGVSVIVDTCGAGNWGNKLTTTTAYSANATLSVTKSGTSVNIYYNGSQCGSTLVISGTGLKDNTRVGLFATDPRDTMDNFTVNP